MVMNKIHIVGLQRTISYKSLLKRSHRTRITTHAKMYYRRTTIFQQYHETVLHSSVFQLTEDVSYVCIALNLLLTGKIKHPILNITPLHTARLSLLEFP